MDKKRLSFGDFVYYYKWYAIVAVIIILLVGIFARECSSTIEDDVVVNMLLSTDASPDAGEDIAADLRNSNVIRDINGDGIYQAYIDVITVPYAIGSEEDLTNGMRASIVLADEEAVLYFVDHDLLEMYEDKGFFRSLEELPDTFWADSDDLYIDAKGNAIGISVRENEYLEQMGISTENLFACFRVSSKGDDDKEYIEKFEAAGDVYTYITQG